MTDRPTSTRARHWTAIALSAAMVLAAAPLVVGQESADRPAADTAMIDMLELPAGVALPTLHGWRAAAGADGSTASFVGPDGDSTIMATVQSVSPDQARAMFAAPIDLGGGITLTPAGPAEENGVSGMADFFVTGTQGAARGVVVYRAMSGGRMLALIGIMRPDAIESVRQVQLQMIAGAETRAVSRQAAPRPTGGSGWEGYLRGRYLIRLYTGNGYQEKEELWLCSDGTYASSAEGGGFSAGGPSAAFGSNRGGTWTATGDGAGLGVLVLNSGDGGESRLQVGMGQDGLYLNGVRWFRGDNTRCN